MTLQSRPTCYLIYCLLFFCLIVPLLYHNAVIAPDRQTIEVGLPAADTGSGYLENRKFIDYTNSYIPEISIQLQGPRSGWLALWTNQNELGRPVFQASGFSPAYVLSWLLFQLTADPWQFITLLSLFTCFMAGTFLFLFCSEVGLHPLAGLIAAITLAVSPQFMYWLAFPMFAAAVCWSAGALWAVTRLANRGDLKSWIVLAFSGYSLLMTAYPQIVVFHAYLLGGYWFFLCYRQIQISRQAVFRFIALTVSALAVATALAVPILRDLALASAESARHATDPSFFAATLPTLANLADAVRLLVLGSVPELLGNPIAATYPLPYDGLSAPLYVWFLAWVALLATFKKTWGWWAAIGLLGLLAFDHALYGVGVKFLGFNLSRSNPLGMLALPVSIVIGFGVDVLSTRHAHPQRKRIEFLGGLFTVGLLILGIAFAHSSNMQVRWLPTSALMLMAALLFAQADHFRPKMLLLVLAMSMMTTSFPLILTQPRGQIAVASPLVNQVRQAVGNAARYAVAEPGIMALTPNLNATIGIASIHSYNSLSSTRYHTLIKALGGTVQTYGRWNSTVAPDYDSPMFWMSNVSLVLSPNILDHDNLALLTRSSGIYLYQVKSRMGESLQVMLPRLPDLDAKTWTMVDPRLMDTKTPVKRRDDGDVVEFEVAAADASILVMSQKFHRDWHARTMTNAGWQSAQTLEVNGVFEGVVLKPGTQRVRLTFEPWARFAWIGHIVWMLLLVLLMFNAWRARRRNNPGRRSDANAHTP